MKKNIIRVSIIMLVSITISFFALYTPIPNTTNEDTYNSKLAIEYIAEIAKEPHSVFDTENHENVRLYLKDKLEEFIGAENVTEMDYDRSLVEVYEGGDELTYDIHNLLGVIQGNSDTAILIVGHYDSRGHIGRTGELGNSYGAADDGYAIAFMLEVARLYGERDLENTIYLLMTDAEEVGLYGAQMAATETALMDNVGFVINIEARGVQGPVYMFETSTNNETIIDFYKNAELPVSYSLATAVYTVMPNATDFTEFLAVEKNGVNFAVLDGLYYYHTPLDNFTNINQSSIEHYGVQILPLVEEFTMNNQYSDVNYFDSDGDQVFFTFLPNVFIAYNELTGTVVNVISFIAVIGLLGLAFMKKEVTLKKIAIAKVVIFGSIIGAVLLGNYVGKLIAFISKVPFDMTYVRTNIGGVPTLITLIFIAVGLGYLYKKYSKENKKAIILVGSFINIFLALLTGIVLSGASFLFLIPGLSGIIVITLENFCKTNLIKKIFYGLIYSVNIIILLPIIYSLYLALTIGGLLALGAILIFYLVLLIPLTFIQLDETY